MSQYAPLDIAGGSKKEADAAAPTQSSVPQNSSNLQKEATVVPAQPQPTGFDNADPPMLARRIPMKRAVFAVIIIGFLFCWIEGGGFSSWSAELLFTGDLKLQKTITAVCFSLGPVALFIGSLLLLLGVLKGKNAFYFGHMGLISLAIIIKLVCIGFLIAGALKISCDYANPGSYILKLDDGSEKRESYTYYGEHAWARYKVERFSDAETKKGDVDKYEKGYKGGKKEIAEHLCTMFKVQMAILIILEILFVPVQAAFIFVSYKACKVREQL